MARGAVVVVAAGSGTRTGLAVNKVLLPLRGASALERSLATLEAAHEVDDVVVVARPVDRDAVDAAVRTATFTTKVRAIVDGGDTRHASEWSGLRALTAPVEAGEIDVIAVHDAARPFVAAELVDAVVDAARTHGGAVPGLPVAPGLFERRGSTLATASIADLRRVQTPQAFRADVLLLAYRAAARSGFSAVDTAQCIERFAPSVRVVVIPGDETNLKLTTAADLRDAGADPGP